MKLNKKIIIFSILTLLITGGIFATFFKSKANNQQATQSVESANLSNTITASGDVEAENQANLSFLTAGRVAYLGVKEGDQVQKGEVLASLDTTIASHNLTAAQAEYRSAKAALDKVIDDIHLFQYGNGGFANVGTSNETQTQKTQRQQAEEAVNVAYDNAQNAEQQLALQSIIAPFNGTVLSIGNIDQGINVTPTSGSNITVVGGGDLKFVADVLEQDINKISVGQPVTITLDADKNNTFNGSISKIADDKTVLSDGRVVFKVDIQSADLEVSAQAGELGSIQVITKFSGKVVVPAWTVLGDKYVWVIASGKPVLTQVHAGQTSNGQTIITSGLNQNDMIILDPEIIAKNKYKIL